MLSELFYILGSDMLLVCYLSGFFWHFLLYIGPGLSWWVPANNRTVSPPWGGGRLEAQVSCCGPIHVFPDLGLGQL